jgi:hypothetical protein
MPEDSIHLEYLSLLKTHVATFAYIFVYFHYLLPSFVEVKERVRSATPHSWRFVLLRLLLVSEMSQILDFCVFG